MLGHTTPHRLLVENTTERTKFVDDISRKYDIKPDADLVAQATGHAIRASRAVDTFHMRMSWQLGVDGSHGSTLRSVHDLIKSLEGVCRELRATAKDSDERVTSKFNKQ